MIKMLTLKTIVKYSMIENGLPKSGSVGGGVLSNGRNGKIFRLEKENRKNDWVLFTPSPIAF
jgi:hypothetical protein